MTPGHDDDLDELVQETRMVSLTDLAAPGGPAGHIKVDPLPTTLRATLEITAGNERGRTFAIGKSLTMIGRVQDVVDIVLHDEDVSRHHAALAYRDGGFTLYDMGSTNGTYVGRDAITEQRLAHGDTLRVGTTELTLWVE